MGKAIEVKTKPFARLSSVGYANELIKLHDSGLALIEKLGQLKWADRDICLKEWLEFTDAFEQVFKEIEN